MAQKTTIERIGELSEQTKGAWLRLLTAVLFILVTLLTLHDTEFLVAGEDVTLPVINLGVPTRLFFFCGPVLITVLYVTLHYHLLKLWKAFEVTDDDDPGAGLRLADQIPNWMLNDYALSLLPRNEPRAGEWSRERNRITKFLIWWLAPLTLLYAWYRFLPARDLPLTIVILLCLTFCVSVGARSRIEAMVRLGDTPREPLTRGIATGAMVAIVGLGAISLAWILGPTGLRPHMDRLGGASATLSAALDGDTEARRRAADYLGLTMNIDRAAVAPLGDKVADYATSLAAFREGWCAQAGLSPSVCGNMPGATIGETNSITLRRRLYCQNDVKPEAFMRPVDCAEYFALKDARFDADWAAVRRAELAKLPELDLSARDLTGVSAEGAQLIRAKFFEGKLTAASLPWARLEGASLVASDLGGLRAYDADFTLANLTDAVMPRADLSAATFTGAVLIRADLREANLRGADLIATDLRGADLRGANLRGARLYRADLDGALIADADFTGAEGLTRDQLVLAIGNRPARSGANGTRLSPSPRIEQLPTARVEQLVAASCWATLPDAIAEGLGGGRWTDQHEHYLRSRLCHSAPAQALPPTTVVGAVGRRDTDRVDPFPEPPFSATVANAAAVEAASAGN